MIAVAVMLLTPCQPVVGRPLNFIGAAGSFRLEASLDPASGDLSTVFSLKLRLIGSGDVSRCAIPDLSKQRSFETRFAVVGPPSKSVDRTGVEFIFPVRARFVAVDSVPAVSIAVWNPSSPKPHYETLISQRLAVTLRDRSDAKMEEFSSGEEVRGGFSQQGVLIAAGAACLAIGGAHGLRTLRRRRRVACKPIKPDSARVSARSPPSIVDPRDRIAAALDLPAGRRTTTEMLQAASDLGMGAETHERLRDALMRRDAVEFGQPSTGHEPSIEAVAALVEQWGASRTTG